MLTPRARSCLIVSAMLATSWGSAPVAAAHGPAVYRTWETFTKAGGLPHDHVGTVYVDGDEVWVGTRGGLARRHGRTWQSWTVDDGLPCPAITAIDRDPDSGDLWLGTWGCGLVRFSAGRFDTFDQMTSGLSGNLVFAVKVANGRVWAANNGGLSAYDPVADAWSLYDERRVDGPHVAVNGLWTQADSVMASAWRDGIRRFESLEDRWRPAALSREHVPAGELDPGETADGTLGVAVFDGGLWWATQSHLLRRVGRGSRKSRTMQRPASDGFVYCLAAFDESEVWLGTSEGLRVLTDWDTRTWVSYRRCGSGPDGVVTLARDGKPIGRRATLRTIPDNQIRSIAFGDGDVWIGTASGLARGSDRVPWDRLPTAPGAESADAPDCPAPLPTDDRRTEGPASVTVAVRRPVTRTVSLPEGRSKTSTRVSELAVHLALEEANATGGFRGRTKFDVFTNYAGYTDYAWGTREDDFAAYASHDDVVGIVGAPAPDDRIVDLLALRGEIPFLAVPSTPDTLDGLTGGNPWIFRCWGDEPRQHRLFLDHLFARPGLTRIAVVRTPGPAARRHLDWWADHASERGRPLVADVGCSQDVEAVDAALARLRPLKPDAILTWASTRASAMILRRMRETGMNSLFIGGGQIVGQEFIDLVGAAPGQVIALRPSPRRADGRADPGFTRNFTRRNGTAGVDQPPDRNAYLSLDATNHLLEAVNLAGAERRAVRHTLAAMAGSAHGEEHFERSHAPGAVGYARLHEGRWQLHRLPDRDEPRASRPAARLVTDSCSPCAAGCSSRDRRRPRPSSPGSR